MFTAVRNLIAAGVTLLLVVGGCSSLSGSDVAGATNSHTYTIGLLTELTGLGASANRTSPLGLKAGTVLASRDAYTIKYVVADTTSTPAGALAAAQKLVEQDHVLAVIAISGLTFAAAPFLESQGVPVIGVAEDSSEWTTDTNMFSVSGALHTNEVSTTEGQFFKMEGAKNLGTLGYAIVPSSKEAAESAAVSAQKAGVKAVYVNTSFPLGGTNVQPAALAMKSAGVDAVTSTVEPNTAFALVTALRQLGDNPKVTLLPDGYGGDLIEAGPEAVQEAQGDYFSLGFEPVEMHTAATMEFQKYLADASVTGDPTYVEYNGYVAVGLLVEALKATGPDPTHASLIAALSKIHDWNALGLFGTHTLDINNRKTIVSGVGNCQWTTKFVGKTFHLVPGADPICGTVIPGVTVSP